MPKSPREFPDLSAEEFRAHLLAAGVPSPADEDLGTLLGHYATLKQWSRGVSLVGPGSAAEVVGRHYAEALVPLSLVRSRWEGRPLAGVVGVDLGSGAGFPGWVLAAVEPRLKMVLVEARERKAAFLEAATRAQPASLSVSVLNARVAAALPSDFPESIDLVTIRALQLSPDTLVAIGARMSPGGLWLSWAGAGDAVAPAGFKVIAELAIPGARHRRVVALAGGDA